MIAKEICESGGESIAVACDVTDVESVKQAEETVRRLLGRAIF